MADSDTSIGSLRYKVVIVTRQQYADPNGPGLIDSEAPYATVRASIIPIGMVTFWSGSEPIDMMPTHRIRFRSDNYFQNTVCIIRTRYSKEGILYTERYRVMRMKQVDGRQRFVECECILERIVDGNTDQPS